MRAADGVLARESPGEYGRRMSLAAPLSRLGTWLAAERPVLFRGRGAPVTAAALTALAKALGRPVPPELAELLGWADGCADEPLLENFYLMSAKEIAEAASMMRGLLRAGDFHGKIDWWVDGWVPFLDNRCGDFVCIDTVGSFGGAPGQLVELLHDAPDRDRMAPSLGAFLEALTSAFEAGLFEGARPKDDETFVAHLRAAIPGYPKASAARKSEATARARINARDAIKQALHPLEGPRADLTRPIDAGAVVKAARFAVDEAVAALGSRRDTATAALFEVFPAPGEKCIAYAVWSASTVGDTWRDGYVVGIDRKGNAIFKEKKVEG